MIDFVIDRLPIDMVSASNAALFKRKLDYVDFTPYILDNY